MDPVDEKASMLSRAGSFWYRTISEDHRPTVQRLSHLSTVSRAYRQLSNASEAALSGGYFQDNYKVIRFSDKNILYYGADEALQKRYVTAIKDQKGVSRPASLTIEDSFLPTIEDGRGLSEYRLPLIFPGGDEDITLVESYRVKFGLLVDRDLYVTVIELEDGTILHQNADFQSTFGLINFRENPVKLFPHMKFMARCYVERKRNIYSYTLGADDVYGPVDRIMTYYRRVQSPRALYLAAAQAAGLPVAREDCTILNVVPLHAGCAYMTDKGRYDAPFPHVWLKAGEDVKAGTVMGGKDIFALYGPGDQLPALESVSLDDVIPVRGLSAPNTNGTLYIGDAFRPAYTGDAATLQKYHDYIHQWTGDDPTGAVQEGNLLSHLLNTVLQNRYIVAVINEDVRTKPMGIKLTSFLQRERPIGCVLLFAPVHVTIVEE